METCMIIFIKRHQILEMLSEMNGLKNTTEKGEYQFRWFWVQ